MLSLDSKLIPGSLITIKCSTKTKDKTIPSKGVFLKEYPTSYLFRTEGNERYSGYTFSINKTDVYTKDIVLI